MDIFYSKVDDTGNSYLKRRQLEYDKNIEEIDYVLKILFTEPFQDMDYKLDDISIINYLIVDREIILNISSDIKGFESSNDAVNVVNQIVKSIVSLNNIDCVTICVNDKIVSIGEIYVVNMR